jgi:aminopeptidase N
VPSLARNFSAPVVIEHAYDDAQLAFLAAHDSDPFNRWEAGQRLAANLILGAARAIAGGAALDWPPSFAEAARRVLDGALDGTTDPAFAAEALTPPSEATLAEQMAVVDPDALHAARNGLRCFLAEALAPQLRAAYERLAPTAAYAQTPAEAGRRALRNLCLGYLAELDTSETRALALNQFEAADNMSDQFAALATLAQYDCPARRDALAAFLARWRHEALVLDKWLAVQAGSRLPGTLDDVRALLVHPAFDLRNPNKVYALLGGFGGNHARFHAADGSGYRFIAERIAELDPLNPQVAARLARRFDRWRRFDGGRQAHARAALEGLHARPGLSRDVFEIVDRALA